MRLRTRVHLLETTMRRHEEELCRCREEVISTNTRMGRLQCQIDTGHTLVFREIKHLGWLGTFYVFECSECGAEVRRRMASLTKEQRAGLIALGYEIPQEKKSK